MSALLDRLFPDGALRASCPWRQAGRLKRVRDYDAEVVARLLARPPGEDLEEVDPTDLRATQPSVTRAGVAYYLDEQYALTGTTYADMHSAANRVPVVYRREDGENLVLTGHHRSSAALLQERPLLVRVVRGGFGGPRDAPVVRPVVGLSAPTRPLHVTPALRVPVEAEAYARQVLRDRGLDEAAVEDRLVFARTGRVGRSAAARQTGGGR